MDDVTPSDDDGMRGHIGKSDRWAYNVVLVDLARNVLFTRGTPETRKWVERFVTALSVVDTKHLPIKTKLNAKKAELAKSFHANYNHAVTHNPCMRRRDKESLECRLRQIYWEELFEYALELATEAGFTIGIDMIHEGPGIRG